MQYLGTEIFRDLIHKDFNVLSLLTRLSETKGNVIIDDYRFLNEYQILKEKNKYDVFAVKIVKKNQCENKHTSENQDIYFDYLVELCDNEYVTDKHYQEILERASHGGNIK